MRNGLARATLAVLTVAASVAGITTAATAAPGDIQGMEVFFQAQGSPIGDLEASYLILEGNGELDLVLRGSNFTPGTFQDLTVHKGTCTAPGTAVDSFEVDPLLRENPSEASPKAISTANASFQGTPGSFRFTQGSTITAIDPVDLGIFTTDYVIVMNEVGSDPADYLCGSPINVQVVGNGPNPGVNYPFFFKELNNSGAAATGQATLVGNTLSMQLAYTGLQKQGSFTSHFQLLRQGALCPIADIATEEDMAGTVEVSLTTDPRSLLPEDTLTPESYFVSVQQAADGTLNYETKFVLTSGEASAFANSTVVIHGFDQNGDFLNNGGPSSVDPGLTADETAVAGCGQFVEFPTFVPDAPAAPIAVVSGDSVNFAWTAPADGGSDIIDYTVTLSNGATKTVTGLMADFDGLADGDYTATVVATNAVGDSLASAASNSVTVDTTIVVPGAPTNVTAQAARLTVTVRWLAPTDPGGAPISGYTVTLSNGASKTVTGLVAVFEDQPTGPVTATVTANNSGGASAASAASAEIVVRDCQDGDVDPDWDDLVVTPEDGSLFRLYCGYFLRYPDEGGFAYWKGIQAGGADLITISDQFALSLEFSNTYGALNSDQFVRLLYQNVLLRPVDEEGYAYWKDLIDTGQLTQGGTMRWVTEGLEFQRVTGTP